MYKKYKLTEENIIQSSDGEKYNLNNAEAIVELLNNQQTRLYLCNEDKLDLQLQESVLLDVIDGYEFIINEEMKRNEKLKDCSAIANICYINLKNLKRKLKEYNYADMDNNSLRELLSFVKDLEYYFREDVNSLYDLDHSDFRYLQEQSVKAKSLLNKLDIELIR